MVYMTFIIMVYMTYMVFKTCYYRNFILFFVSAGLERHVLQDSPWFQEPGWRGGVGQVLRTVSSASQGETRVKLRSLNTRNFVNNLGCWYRWLVRFKVLILVGRGRPLTRVSKGKSKLKVKSS